MNLPPIGHRSLQSYQLLLCRQLRNPPDGFSSATAGVFSLTVDGQAGMTRNG